MYVMLQFNHIEFLTVEKNKIGICRILCQIEISSTAKALQFTVYFIELFSGKNGGTYSQGTQLRGNCEYVWIYLKIFVNFSLGIILKNVEISVGLRDFWRVLVWKG